MSTASLDPSAVVETDAGAVSGYVRDGVHVFRGIPYAAPATGRNRWAPPQPVRPWAEVRPTAVYGSYAPQGTPGGVMDLLSDMGGAEMSEHCLFLNVWTPALDDRKRPVMVWVHGGAFTMGAASQPTYDGRRLALAGDVVVVSVNYRLGALGFLNLNDVTGGRIEATGNEGLLDQLAALKWVQRNIARFGGDPGNVTLFGESAGGMSTGALLSSPEAQTTFHKAILQSGGCHTVNSNERCARIAEDFLRLLEVDPNAPDGLYKMPLGKLLKAQAEFAMIAMRQGLGGMPFQPCIDGRLLTELPIDTIRRGGAAHIPLLVGTTRDEYKLFLAMEPGARKMTDEQLRQRMAMGLGRSEDGEFAEAYREYLAQMGRKNTPMSILAAFETDRMFAVPAQRLLEEQRSHQEQVYQYRFDWPSPAAGGALGACHSLEVGFVFGTYDDGGAGRFHGRNSALSRQMQQAWVTFARDGAPQLDDQHWPEYSADGPLMSFAATTGLDAGIPPELTALWAQVEDGRVGAT